MLALIPLLPFAGFLVNGTMGKRLPKSVSGGVADERAAASSVSDLGVVLFSGAGDGSAGYMFAFEVTSILIIIAMVGAVVIARKRED